MKNYHKNVFKRKIENAARTDPDSRLGTYLLVNPELKAPEYDKKFEFQRVLVMLSRGDLRDIGEDGVPQARVKVLNLMN